MTFSEFEPGAKAGRGTSQPFCMASSQQPLGVGAGLQNYLLFTDGESEHLPAPTSLPPNRVGLAKEILGTLSPSYHAFPVSADAPRLVTYKVRWWG